jgi:hypothetical protein
LTSTLAIGVAAASTPASAITGPAPAPTANFGFVAKVDAGGRGCTGALVNAWWVVTAASCFTDPGQTLQAGAPAKPATVTVGRPDLTTTTGHVVAVTTLVPRTDRNLVLARLATAVTDVAPVALATTPAAVDQTLTMVGYGRTATEWVPDTQHTAQFTVRDTNATTFGVAGATPDAAICKGDAGGPALRDASGRLELVGIHHTSWQHGCYTETETNQGATETRTDDIAAWITQNAALPVPGDIDGDGKPDFLALSLNGDELWFIPNTSTPGQPSRGAGRLISKSWQSVKQYWLVDFDGDGKTDIVGIVGTDQMYAWRNTTTAIGEPSFSGQFDLGTAWSTVTNLVFGDFTGDGKIDIAAWDSGTRDSLWIIVNDSTPGNPHRAPGSIRLTSGWRTVSQQRAVDFDGDGRTDLVGLAGTDQMYTWRNTGTDGKPSFSGPIDLGTAWSSTVSKVL